MEQGSTFLTSSDLPTPLEPMTVILKLSRMRLGLAGAPLSRGALDDCGCDEGDETLSMLSWPSRDERLRMLETVEPALCLLFILERLCGGRGDSMSRTSTQAEGKSGTRER